MRAHAHAELLQTQLDELVQATNEGCVQALLDTYEGSTSLNLEFDMFDMKSGKRERERGGRRKRERRERGGRGGRRERKRERERERER